MEQIYSDIDDYAKEIEEQVISWRQHIHQHPELSNREVNTAGYVKEKLNESGVDEVRTGIAGHGVVGIIRGTSSATQKDVRLIALRADMDALPVKELVDVAFASKVVDDQYPGGPFPVAHACGHDCHVAALLGAAWILVKLKDKLNGTVMLVFQPAEEGPPVGEEGGARQMIKEGAFDDPVPTMVYGMHVGPLPKGVIAYRKGVQFAASCLVKVKIHGEQVHASTPWLGQDPMPALGAILLGAGQLYRQFDAKDAITISIGHVEDVGRFNIIGENVTLWGTLRTTTKDLLPDIQKKLTTLVQATAQAHGCHANVDYLQNVPSLTNTEEWVDAALPTLERVLGGKDKVVSTSANMAYDDVSELVNKFGGLYVMLGAQDVEFNAEGQVEAIKEGRGMVPNHNPHFYADDGVLVDAVRLHCNVAIDHLNHVLQC